jgi:hypothetical protein
MVVCPITVPTQAPSQNIMVPYETIVLEKGFNTEHKLSYYGA